VAVLDAAAAEDSITAGRYLVHNMDKKILPKDTRIGQRRLRSERRG